MNIGRCNQHHVPKILVILLTFLISCKESGGVKVLDEQPKILSVSIPGIPQENIILSQSEKLITIVMPENLARFELIPKFILSDQAFITGNWADTTKKISLASYCTCRFNRARDLNFDKIEQVRIDNALHTSYYQIRFKENGQKLRLKELEKPVEIDLKTSYYNIAFPVANYYGSSFVQFIAVSKVGSAMPNWIGGLDVCFDVCEGKLNTLGISISGYLIGPGKPVLSFSPGLYDLDLMLSDGSVVHADSIILVK